MEPTLNILNLSVEDFVMEKIKYHEREIQKLKDKYLSNNVFTTNRLEIKQESNHNTNLVSTLPYTYPPKKEIQNNIINYLRDNKRIVKTLDIVKHYHLNDLQDQIIKDNLVRRYSGRLNELADNKKIYKRKEDGERGYNYTYYADMLEDTTRQLDIAAINRTLTFKEE